MSKIKMTILFTAEIVLFVLTGMYLAVGNYGTAVISLIFAVIVAGYVGKLIAKQAVEEYKKEAVKNE